MKVHRTSGSTLNHLDITPPYALQEFLNIDDLITLKHTHRFFNTWKLCKIASPTIQMFTSVNYSKVLEQFPKAKLMSPQPNDTNWKFISTTTLNITSLDLTNGTTQTPENLSSMTNLTFLDLFSCNSLKTEMLDPLTKLIVLSLAYNTQIKGSTLKKLTSLRKLNLDANLMITDQDIESLPITSLTLQNNVNITPSLLKKLNLKELRIGDSTLAATNEIFQMSGLTHLDLGVSLLVPREPILPKKLSAMYMNDDSLQYLTNLTYLELRHQIFKIDISVLFKLETLKISAAELTLDFPLQPLDHLSHLELSGFTQKLNFSYIKNLTYLKTRCNLLRNTPELYELNLKHLMIMEGHTYHNLDISRFKSLTSLEIFNYAFIVRDIRPFISSTLESLILNTYNWSLTDGLLSGLSNLKYLTICKSTQEITGSCFKNMPKLFSLRIQKNNLSRECICSLNNRGIMIKFKN
ncbi:MAG: hypothetical protein Harvfovirus22_20 [Harvfovirus sp.]|uniref:Leucine-rich repeat protein n=1 Tax=Harvfovirus sp. TaxID=2487768 RepID=A0A3G5A222_9VIRU|nr:MAG: hypothetical protein Harvfovirus22_20 [Harvfovirus sp.]